MSDRIQYARIGHIAVLHFVVTSFLFLLFFNLY